MAHPGECLASYCRLNVAILFVASLVWASAAVSGTPIVASVTVLDGGANEAGQDIARLRFDLDQAAGSTLFVEISYSGSATTSDFVGAQSLVIFGAGTQTQVVEFMPALDNLVEGPESLIVTIEDVGSYDVGSPASAGITIQDDPPIVTLSPMDTEASETGATGSFLMERTGGHIAQTLAVEIARSGDASSGDYDLTPGASPNFIFPGSSDSVTVFLEPRRDNEIEAFETATFDIAGAGTTYLTGASTTASVIIADDPPVVALSLLDGFADEAGMDPGVLAVHRTGGDTGFTLRVQLATDGSASPLDYTVSPPLTQGGVLFPAGSDEIELQIIPVQDDLIETTEVVTVQIEEDPGYIVGTTMGPPNLVQIQDDPTIVSLSAAPASTAEGAQGAEAVVTVARSGGTVASALVVTLDAGGAADSSDYEISPPFVSGTQITIPAGQSTAQFSVAALLDDQAEGDEVVQFTAVETANYLSGAAAQVTLLDEQMFADGFESVAFAKCDLAKAIPEAHQHEFVVTQSVVLDLFTGIEWKRIRGGFDADYESPIASLPHSMQSCASGASSPP